MRLPAAKGVAVTCMLAMVLALPSIAPAASGMSDAESLLGVWRVTVDGEARTRTLILRSVLREGPSVVYDGVYGWSDAKHSTLRIALESRGDELALVFQTPARSDIDARRVSQDEWRGTFRSSKKTASVTIVREDVIAPDARAPAPGPVTLIYVAASNCPSCTYWERGDGHRFEKSALSKQVRYVEVRSGSYMTILSGAWPEDLRWVPEKLRIRSGTPRFVVVRDRAVLMHRFGTSAWSRDVLPLLERLVDARSPASR